MTNRLKRLVSRQMQAFWEVVYTLLFFYIPASQNVMLSRYKEVQSNVLP